jgi:hypothetical protein
MNSLPQSESKVTMSNGNSSVSCSTPATIDFDALLRIEQFSVQPITTSVIVSVRANSPISVGPQCATVSASITPGRSGVSSAQVRMLIELRSSADGFVVEMPLIRIRSRAGFKYRSTVAALIASSSANARTVANGLSRSPASASSGSHKPSMTTRYLPHGIPINAHTCSRRSLASSLKPRGRSVRPSTRSAGSSSLGPVSIRRAVERPIPAVATTRSRIVLLSAFDALRYRVRSLLATCRLAAMSNLAFHIGQAFRATRSK